MRISCRLAASVFTAFLLFATPHLYAQATSYSDKPAPAARDRLVSGTMARVALGRRPHADGSRNPHGARRRIRLEPNGARRGQLRLDWLDRAVAIAAKHGIYIVVGTPTAAPPAWLTRNIPKPCASMKTGHRVEHGNRQQFNFANPKYRELAAEIAEQMAKRFGHNPYVAGLANR